MEDREWMLDVFGRATCFVQIKVQEVRPLQRRIR
jgi:hypothetical protein